ncbi:MAG: hypothetical protein IJ261_06160, partial [Clostridia bacterium]|nr:hypothetical protein [Clostridia bacterium]
YNVEEFSLESAVSAYSSAAYSAEVELGVKRGVDSIDTIAVRFIDADGSPSNIYDVDLYDGALYEEDFSAYSTHTSCTNSVKPDNKVATTAKRVKNTKKPTEKVTEQSEYVNVDSISEYFEYNTANTNLSVNDTGEETTVLTQKQLNLQKAFSYAAVAALILLSLGICVAVNVAHDKRESERKSKK